MDRGQFVIVDFVSAGIHIKGDELPFFGGVDSA